MGSRSRAQRNHPGTPPPKTKSSYRHANNASKSDGRTGHRASRPRNAHARITDRGFRTTQAGSARKRGGDATVHRRVPKGHALVVRALDRAPDAERDRSTFAEQVAPHEV